MYVKLQDMQNEQVNMKANIWKFANTAFEKCVHQSAVHISILLQI
jgi:hypothetical protein